MHSPIPIVLSFLLAISLACDAPQASPYSSPWPLHIIDNTSLGSDGTKVKDVNGDGLIDIVCGWEEGGVVRVYFNPDSASNWPYVELPAPNVEDALLVDLDEDGSVDVVSFSEGKHKRITVHWAPDTESYRDATQWISQDIPVTIDHSQWMFGSAMDVDQQNGVDLIVGSKGEGAIVGWLEAPKNPRVVSEWKLHNLISAGWIMSIACIDIDRDGQKDILFSDRKGEHTGLKWLKHPGINSPDLFGAWETHIIGMQGLEPMFLAVEPPNKDQLWNIWIANKDDHIHHYSQVTIEGKQWTQDLIAFPPQSSQRGKSAAVGDLDGDGSVDIVSTYESAQETSGVLWSSASSGVWTHHDISGPLGIKYDFAYLLDMDADGDLDVLCSEERETQISPGGLGVIWYENPR